VEDSKMKFLQQLIVAGSVVVGLGRFAIPGHALSYVGTYEAFTHIWVGALIVWSFDARYRPVAPIALGVTTILEVIMFMMR
jgi:hypothetical protein